VRDENMDDVQSNELIDSAPYAPGRAHKVRILGANWLDGTLVGSLRASVLANPIVTLSDAKPGMRIRCRIAKVRAIVQSLRGACR
jgi:hypothetical protein